MRPILFKILLLICIYPASLFAQQLSQAEHCMALDKKLESEFNLYENYVTAYLNHLQECQPSIENKFLFYKKLLTWLLSIPLSPIALEQLDRVTQSLLNEIPLQEVESLEEFSLDTWEVLSQKAQTEDIVFNVSPSLSYHSEKPLTVKQSFQKLEGVFFKITEMTQKFSSQFSICRNTEEFQHLLRPLNSFLQDFIFKIAQNISYDQLRLFQQLHTLYSSFQSQQFHHTSDHLQFISWTHLPPPFIKYISESINWDAPPFQNKYDWLKPMLSILKSHVKITEAIQNYCVPYQPFLNTEFIEHHYIAEFEEPNQLFKSGRRELLEIIQENFKEKDHVVIFHSYISSENTRIYLYFVRHHLHPE